MVTYEELLERRNNLVGDLDACNAQIQTVMNNYLMSPADKTIALASLESVVATHGLHISMIDIALLQANK